MRTFRVVLCLEGSIAQLFTVSGGLKRRHAGEKFRSLRAAQFCADFWSSAGWTAHIVRRIPNGWTKVDSF